MVLISMLPIGLMQAWASVEYGTWYARSAEFLHSAAHEPTALDAHDRRQHLRSRRVGAGLVYSRIGDRPLLRRRRGYVAEGEWRSAAQTPRK